MPEYQVLARRYRPQKFADVYGQEAIVTTLKNAILHKRLAHAYLFCGSRGTGKTTLARIFAKALNCQTVRDDLEPCNHCSSCLEISSGSSLEVLEIDGASNRGIDDIRQIKEIVGYASAAGGYKIYLIDEVHMLTKEAFNALLKTLEEPPPRVLFFFATTEPHKLPTTILSRCQRFNLNRISLELILKKLAFITEQQNIDISEDALRIIASRAEGGMRDAESLLDQILAFHEGKITAESVADVLGIVSRDLFFELDQAVKKSHLASAFSIAQRVFSQGKDLVHFVESLADHFRTILIVKISNNSPELLTLSPGDSAKYAETAKIYTQEQSLTILDFLVEAINQIRFMPSVRIGIEALLLRIIRIQQRVPVEFLVKQLNELEQSIKNTPLSLQQNVPALQAVPLEGKIKELVESKSIQVPISPPPPNKEPKIVEQKEAEPVPAEKLDLLQKEPKAELQKEVKNETSNQKDIHKIENHTLMGADGLSITIDPTPTLKELGIQPAPPTKSTSIIQKEKAVAEESPKPPISTSIPENQLSGEDQIAKIKKQSRYDTILQFAAIELEGSLKKTAIKGF